MRSRRDHRNNDEDKPTFIELWLLLDWCKPVLSAVQTLTISFHRNPMKEVLSFLPFTVEDLGHEICCSSGHPVCLPTCTSPNPPHTHLFLTITLRRTLHSETCLLWPQLSLVGTYRHSRRRKGDRGVKTGKVCARSNASFHAVRLPHSSWL